jgi:predicted MFS family arabinose efflux permease
MTITQPPDLAALKEGQRKAWSSGDYSKVGLKMAETDEPTHGRRRQRSVSFRVRRLLPLVLATLASQAVLVVLAPTIVEVGREFGVSVGAVGQARSALAGAAIASSLGIAPFLDRLSIRPLLLWGALLAIAGSAGAALSPSLTVFLSVHALIGIGFACLLSAGFAGVAAFSGEDRAWAMSYVVGGNALAWIVVNPLAGVLTDVLSWRAAHAVPAAIALCVLASVRAAPGERATVAAGVGLRGVLADPSARRWILAELIAYFTWGAHLTFTGAFFIERYGVAESAMGILLALGAAVFFVTSVRGTPLVGRLPRPRLVAAAALVMAVLIALQFNTYAPVWIALVAWFLSAAAGGIRTTVSSTLGLTQLPDQPGSMMAARTGATQMGYLLGGLIGGAALAWSGYAALGIILATSLILCAALVLRVTDPSACGSTVDGSVLGTRGHRADGPHDPSGTIRAETSGAGQEPGRRRSPIRGIALYRKYVLLRKPFAAPRKSRLRGARCSPVSTTNPSARQDAPASKAG